MVLPQVPGSNILAKMIISEESIKKTILHYFNIDTPYFVVDNKFPDNSECDVLMIPNRRVSEEFLPIIVEIQLTVDVSFYQRAKRYCLNVADRYNIAPLLLIFNTDDFASAHFRESVFILENNYYTANTTPWCLKIIIFNKDTIYQDLQNRRIPKLIMLSYFFSSKEVDIHKLEHHDNADLELLYRIAANIFGDIDIESQKNIENIKSVEDTFSFIKSKTGSAIIQQNCDSALARLIETRLNLENVEVDLLTDLDFIEYYYQTSQEMLWKEYYTQGRQLEHFSRYSDHNSLKTAYFKRNV